VDLGFKMHHLCGVYMRHLSRKKHMNREEAPVLCACVAQKRKALREKGLPSKRNAEFASKFTSL